MKILTLIKPHRFLMWVFILFNYISLSAQDVSVNHENGSVTAAIPVTQITDRDITIPLTLVYSSNGNRPGQPISQFGTGWSLTNYTGTISRILNGLPDDINTSSRKGWIRSNNHSDVGSFAPAADENYSVYSDEYSDFNSLDGFKGFDGTNTIRDTEPDIFVVNAYGLHFKFLFDNSGNISTIPEFYGEITPNYESGNPNNPIQSFTIEREGMTWLFNLSKTSTIQSFPIDVSGFALEKREFYMYQTMVSYRSDWYLTNISSTIGGNIYYEYEQYNNNLTSLIHTSTYRTTIKDTISAQFWNGTAWKKKDFYYLQINQPNALVLKEIYGAKSKIEMVSGEKIIPAELDFTAMDFRDMTQQNPLITTMNVYDLDDSTVEPVQQIKFNSKYFSSYLYYIFQPFLFSISYSARGKYLPSIYLDYYGMESYGGIYNTHLFDEGQQPIRIIPGNAKKSDLYGFASSTPLFSTTTSSFNTSSETDLIQEGMLKKVIFQNKGYTSIFYEPNTWFDPIYGIDKYGGGLRVARTLTHDGLDSGNDITINYEYKNGSHSSGVLLKKPIYEIDLGFNYNPDTDAVTYFDRAQFETSYGINTTRVIFDRNQSEDYLGPYYNVGYEKVKVFQSGKGYSVYDYSFPVTWEDTADPFGQLPHIKVARKNYSTSYTSWTYGPLKPTPGLNNYPFFTNPFNYFESGQLSKVTVYNEAGLELSVSDYDYTLLPGINSIKGLKIQQVPTQLYYGSDVPNTPTEKDLFIYAPYLIRSGCHSQISKKTDKVYDDNRNWTTTETNYEYSSGTNSLLKRQYSTDSQGNERGVRFKYAIDYVTSGTSLDAVASQIKLMKDNGYENRLIESREYIKAPGGIEKVLSAQLATYDYTSGWLTPAESYYFQAQDPVSPFTESGVSGNTFSKDSRYILSMKTVLKDNTNKHVISVRNRFDTLSTVYDSKHRQAASFGGVYTDEVGFINFDGITANDGGPVSFTRTGSPPLGTGRLYGKCYQMPANSGALSRTLKNRKPLKTFVFSCWIKSTANGSLSLNLTGASTKTISFTNTNGEWKYYEKELLTNNTSTLTFTFTSSVAISIDDIAIYPAESSFSQVNYGLHDQIVGSFGEKGFGSSTTFDNLGRPLTTKDQNGFVISKYSYDDDFSTDVTNQIALTSYMNSSGELYAQVLPESINGNVSIIWKVVSGYDSKLNTPSTASFTEGSTSNVLRLITTGSDFNQYTVFAKITYNGIIYYKAILAKKKEPICYPNIPGDCQ